MEETVGKARGTSHQVLTEEIILGPERRWRRFGDVTSAGASTNDDGSADYGIFGPGSIVWEVLLHPATVVFESAAQATYQVLYKPITAGVRDQDPLAMKARAGTLTYFDWFERLQRNSGMHAPMWLGDTSTATKMATHLHRIHGHVTGEVIDVGEPELGGYAAAEPRDAMWAAITEMHSLLLMYEKFAWHGDEPPHALTPEQRDQYVRESAPYLRLVGAREEEIPTTMAELDALYDRDIALFGRTPTMNIDPVTGDNYLEVWQQVSKQNWHPSHQLAVDANEEVFDRWTHLMFATFPPKILETSGFDEQQQADLQEQLRQRQHEIRAFQQPENERRIMRLMWGPDGMNLIDSARQLHAEARSNA